VGSLPDAETQLALSLTGDRGFESVSLQPRVGDEPVLVRDAVEFREMRLDFEQVLKEVVWRLVTEGRISYRQITDGGVELRVGWACFTPATDCAVGDAP
jgi:hypothetical protein